MEYFFFLYSKSLDPQSKKSASPETFYGHQERSSIVSSFIALHSMPRGPSSRLIFVPSHINTFKKYEKGRGKGEFTRGKNKPGGYLRTDKSRGAGRRTKRVIFLLCTRCDENSTSIANS